MSGIKYAGYVFPRREVDIEYRDYNKIRVMFMGVPPKDLFQDEPERTLPLKKYLESKIIKLHYSERPVILIMRGM